MGSSIRSLGSIFGGGWKSRNRRGEDSRASFRCPFVSLQPEVHFIRFAVSTKAVQGAVDGISPILISPAAFSQALQKFGSQ